MRRGAVAGRLVPEFVYSHEQQVAVDNVGRPLILTGMADPSADSVTDGDGDEGRSEDVKIGPQAGNLVLLHRRGNIAEGRFDPTFGSFMGIRQAGETYRRPRNTVQSQTRECAARRATTLDLTRPWELSAFWFFAYPALPPGTTFSLRGEGPDQPPRNTVLRAPDGSWCEVREEREDHGTRTVWESGPHALWCAIEDAHTRWCRLGRPGWDRFGLTVTAERQSIWLDTPDSGHI